MELFIKSYVVQFCMDRQKLHWSNSVHLSIFTSQRKWINLLIWGIIFVFYLVQYNATKRYVFNNNILGRLLSIHVKHILSHITLNSKTRKQYHKYLDIKIARCDTEAIYILYNILFALVQCIESFPWTGQIGLKSTRFQYYFFNYKWYYKHLLTYA